MHHRNLALAAVLVAISLVAVTLPAAGRARAQTGISIVNFRFDPANVSVAAGATVIWTNNGTATHTTTSNTGDWDSGNLAPGASYSRPFPAEGTFSYRCNIHFEMQGVIRVTGAAAATATPTRPAAATATPTTTPAPAATATPTSPPAATATSAPANPTATAAAVASPSPAATATAASPSASASPSRTASASPSASASPASSASPRGSVTPGAPGATVSGGATTSKDDGGDGGVPVYVWGIVGAGALALLIGALLFVRQRGGPSAPPPPGRGPEDD